MIAGPSIRSINLSLAAVVLGLGTGSPALAQIAGGPSAGALAAAAEARAAPLPAPARRASPAAMPRISAIRFSPSVYLAPPTLEAISARHRGQRLGQAQLGALVAEVNSLYAAAGIAFAEAIVNRIDSRSGAVDIHLLEARVGRVSYRAQHVRDSYLDWRLGIAPGQPADNRAISERLNRLSLTDNLAVEAAFAPGAAYGETDLTVRLAELPNFSGRVTLDNSASRSTGQERLGFALQWRSLTGRHDPLTLSGAVTRGAQNLALGYARNVTPGGARIGIALDLGQSRSLTAPVIANRSRGLEISLTRPLRMERDRRLQFGAALLAFSKRETIAGAPLSDQEGAGLRLGLSSYRRGETGFLSGGGSLLLLSWREAVGGGAGRQIAPALNAYLTGAWRVTPDLAVSVQASAQLALRDRMPSRFRFGASGTAGVRGYPDALAEGDSGLWLRLQLERAEPLRIGEGIGLRPYLFLDAGRAWDRAAGRHIGQDLLASVGLGGSFGLGDRLTGDLFIAKPLRDANGFAARGAVQIRASLTLTF